MYLRNTAPMSPSSPAFSSSVSMAALLQVSLYPTERHVAVLSHPCSAARVSTLLAMVSMSPLPSLSDLLAALMGLM